VAQAEHEFLVPELSVMLSGNDSYTRGTTTEAESLIFDGAKAVPKGGSLTIGAGV
jgi:hypothetical protein